MSAASPRDNVARSLRPVVIVVVATKMAILGFLFASMAGVVPTPSVAEASPSVYLVDTIAAE